MQNAKEYFKNHPRPWELGFRDRGLGRGDFAILDSNSELITEVSKRSDAKMIIAAVNAYENDSS